MLCFEDKVPAVSFHDRVYLNLAQWSIGKLEATTMMVKNKKEKKKEKVDNNTQVTVDTIPP